MNCKKSAVFIVLFLSGFGMLHASNPVNVKQFINHTDWNFVENKGQLADPNGKVLSDIKYYGHQGGVYLYCKPGIISFVFTKVEKEKKDKISEASATPDGSFTLSPAGGGRGWKSPKNDLQTSKITTSRTDLILLNSNLSAQIIASDQQEYYENYYTSGDADHGITNVHTYKTITYKNIYPHIDMVLHASPNGPSWRANPSSAKATASNGGMKYEFVVYPGGNVSDIQMQWNGLERIKKLKNSGIEYSCTLGKMDEGNPVSFQPAFAETTAGEQGEKPIRSSFLKTDNRIAFKIGGYDKTKTLVIDPTLEWGTYFGGSGGEEAFGIATDDSGNVFITGITSSLDGIATKGAYQTSLAGGYGADAFIAKFNKRGDRLWATYFGAQDVGGHGTTATAIAIDHLGNLFITGNTTEISGIATTGAFQTSFSYDGYGAAQPDAFLAKFDQSGMRQWATYYGSSSNDYAWSVATDSSGNVYFIGEGGAGLGTTGAYQSNIYNINQVFLAKFNAGGKRQWATYFGKSGGGNGYGVATDGLGNVYITGGTLDSLSDIVTAGAYQSSFGGGIGDVFLAKFNDNGKIKWATYFGGQNIDEAFGISIDITGGVYIIGYTQSISGIATKGAFKTSYGSPASGQLDSGDAFLAKFDTSGTIQWATYFGNPTTFGFQYGISADTTGNVYITGTTSNISGIASNGAYQTTNGGGFDVFLAKFDRSGMRDWATYYGGNLNEFAAGIVPDKFGNVYVTGYTASKSGIATSGAFQSSYGGGYSDAFLARFGNIANDAGIPAIINPTGILCGNSQSLNVQLHNYGKNVLDSVLIKFSVNGNKEPVYHWKGKIPMDSSTTVSLGNYSFPIGTDTIKSWTSMPNGVIDSVSWNDSSSVIIKINPFPNPNVGQSTYQICTGTHIKIGANAQPDYSYLWASEPAGYTSTMSDPVVNPDSNTVYTLKVTDTSTGCTNNNSAKIFVGIAKAPIIDVGKNQSICNGNSAQIGSNAIIGDTYSWTSNPSGFTSTVANLNVTPKKTTSYLLTVSNAAGCTNFDSVTITVNRRPDAITGPNAIICLGSGFQLGVSPFPGDIYSWTSSPTGFSSTVSEPVDTPKTTTTYYLKETDPVTGCADSNSLVVAVIQHPVVSFDVKHIGGFEYQFVVSIKNKQYLGWQSYLNFGDTSNPQIFTDSDFTATHIYSKNGKYFVTLTTYSSQGNCAVTDTYLVVINEQFALNIYPNPFNLQTDINYTLVKHAYVRISITDEIGRRIGTLLDKQLIQGEYNTYYSGAPWRTRPGMYFVIFQIDDTLIVKKMIQIDSIYY